VASTKAAPKRAATAAKQTATPAKASAKKAPAKKVAPAKASAKKAVAKKAVPAKASAKKAPAKKVAPAKASAKKAVAKKAPAKKASAAKKAPATKAPAKKRAAPSPFPERWLTKQQEMLEVERATYLRQAETLQAEADMLVADFESGDVQFDEESGEGDTLSMERERDLQLSAQARAAIEEIDHALAKFASGTYGICEASGQPIPKERLEAIPWARERVEFKVGGFGRR